MSHHQISRSNLSQIVRGPIVSSVGISLGYVAVNAVFFSEVVHLVKSAANPFFAILIIFTTCVGQLLSLFHVFAVVKEAKFALDVERSMDEVRDATQPDQENQLSDVLSRHSPRLAGFNLFASFRPGHSKAEGYELPVLRSFMQAFETAVQRRASFPNYLASTLIGLGLFGTFLGLITTLKEVAGLIGLFAVGGDTDTGDMMSKFFQQLSGPLAGMGEAFVASLFGLGGSIVNGFQVLALKKLQTNTITAVEATFYETAETIYGPATTDGQGKQVALDVRLAQMQLEEIAALRHDIGKQTDAILVASSKMRQASDGMAQTMAMLERIATQEEIRPRFEQVAVVLEQRLDTLVRKLDDSQMVQHSLLNVTKEYAERMAEMSSHTSQLVTQASLNVTELASVNTALTENAIRSRTSLHDSNEQLKTVIHTDLGVLAAAVAEVGRIAREQNMVMGDINQHTKQANLQLSSLEANALKTFDRIQPQVVEMIARLEKNEQAHDHVAKFDWAELQAKVDKIQASVGGAKSRGN